LLAKKVASYITSTFTPSFRVEAKVVLTLSSKDEAKVALTPPIKDKVYRVVKDALSTPSFRVKGFRSISLLNSTISSTITKLRSIAKRVYLEVR